MKEEIAKKAGEDGIAIESISASLVKARALSNSYLVTFVVAYAPTEEAAEGKKAKDMVALNKLGTYGRDVLNKNNNLLLCFAEDKKLALLNSFAPPEVVFCAPSKVPTAARDKHLWTTS